MCIRDRVGVDRRQLEAGVAQVAGRIEGWRMLLPVPAQPVLCLLYTSDAADDLLCVDLGGRRIIKKKKILMTTKQQPLHTNENSRRNTDAQHTTSCETDIEQE